MTENNTPVRIIEQPGPLFYCNPFFAPNRFGNDSIHYYGANTGDWRELETYGGKLTENVVQAIARD